MSTDTGPCVLRTQGLRKDYGRDASLVHAVDGVDLTVAPGETVAIMGPSGCGKSTLLYLLGGLDRATGGEIWLDGQDLSRMSERALAGLRCQAIGFVFQAFHLMDELTAVENVELPALLAGRSPRAARRRAEELLERVGLANRAKFLPTQLSGGQRQRVAVARALVADPLVVLADEPTGNLDNASTRDVLQLFGQLQLAGQTLVIVTHDVQVAATADRMISMSDGTFIKQTMPPERTGGRRCARAGLEG
jgi:ABC-type lipoprotein export system ATPase subunit